MISLEIAVRRLEIVGETPHLVLERHDAIFFLFLQSGDERSASLSIRNK